MRQVADSNHTASLVDMLQQENTELRRRLAEVESKYAHLQGIHKAREEQYQQLKAEKMEVEQLLREKTQFIIEDQKERNAAEYAEAIRRAQFAKRGPKTNVNLHKDIIYYRNQGMSIRKIAKELDCSTSTVQRVLKECSDN